MSFSNQLANAQPVAAKDPWALARRRVHSYLSLQRLSEITCEHILQQTTQQLPNQPPKSEAEQIQLFLQIAQKIAQLAPMSDGRVAHWTARTTGPRVERSSIKVAPLQAISLRLLAKQSATDPA